MSTSRHPVALRLERHVSGPTRLLATVMALPLVDGIFPALVIAGALTVPFGIVETGVLIFGGSATVAVVLAEMEGTPRENALSILLLGAVLIPVAAVEAALAQSIRTFIDPVVFHRFAALVIVAVAAKTASAEIGEYLPRPGAIIGLGLLASVQPAGAKLIFEPELGLLLRAAAAAAVGVGFALAVALAGDRLRDHVDIDRFRFGSAVALGTLALTIANVGIDTEAPVALAVLCVTAVFSYDPSPDSAPPGAPTNADGVATTDGGADDPAADAAVDTADPTPEPNAGIDPVDADDDQSSDQPSRAPWL
ncbi:DUF5794 domain-containing protein [Halobaculum sp. P14]|uniref:DUF5794 domain-containing protein n=1 Tax=Halobaculum sp. P14 TaxID=3421638 RepID=UPI003EBE7236